MRVEIYFHGLMAFYRSFTGLKALMLRDPHHTRSLVITKEGGSERRDDLLDGWDLEFKWLPEQAGSVTLENGGPGSSKPLPDSTTDARGYGWTAHFSDILGNQPDFKDHVLAGPSDLIAARVKLPPGRTMTCGYVTRDRAATEFAVLKAEGAVQAMGDSLVHVSEYYGPTPLQGFRIIARKHDGSAADTVFVPATDVLRLVFLSVPPECGDDTDCRPEKAVHFHMYYQLLDPIPSDMPIPELVDYVKGDVLGLDPVCEAVQDALEIVEGPRYAGNRPMCPYVGR